MKFNLQIIFSIQLIALVMSNEIMNDVMEPKKRVRRYLKPLKGARFLFRLNGKDNIVMINTLWAHGYGFRANYDLIVPKENNHYIFRRDVYNSIEGLVTQYGFDGRACILNSFCEASKDVTPESGMLFKIFKTIFRNRTAYESSNSLPKGDEKDYPYLASDDCEELHQHCPMSLLNLATYTDT